MIIIRIPDLAKFKHNQQLIMNYQKLLETEFTLTSLINSVTDEIIVLDSNNSVRYINTRAKTHLFSKLPDSVGQSFEVLLQALFQKYEVEGKDKLVELDKLVRRPYSFVKDTVKISVKSSKKTYQVCTSPIFDEKLGHLGRIWQFQDVTLQDKLDDMKTEFISIASHQLRTPITNIRWNIDMILEKDYGEVPMHLIEPLQLLQRSTNQLNELISDLLNISRLEKGDQEMVMEEINLNEMFEDLKNIFELKVKDRKQKLEMTINGLNRGFKTNKFSLREVVKNLIENAIKYSGDETYITVRADFYIGGLTLKVSDQGMGIPEDQLDKIFEKFYRANNALSSEIDGTGLGLFYVGEVVKKFKGNINVESKLNEGTTFIINLPS